MANLFRALRHRQARLGSAARALSARMIGVQIERPVFIGAGTQFDLGMRDGAIGEISIGKAAEFQCGAVLRAYGGRIRLSRNVFIGPYVVIYGHGGVEIGDDTLISMHARILSSNHTVPEIGKNIRAMEDRRLPTRIGRDVWLGAGVTVLGGVTIGDGCVVGAGSVVATDLESGSIAVGVPARLQKMRLDRAARE